MALPVKKQSSSSSDSSSSSSSDDQKKQKIIQNPQQISHIVQQPIQQQTVVYQQGSTLSQLPVGVTEEQVRRSLAGVSLDIVKGEVRQEYIPLTRVETEYKEEVQYEKVPRQVKVTDYYQVEYQEEKIPQVYQHTITEYIPLQKIIPIVNYKAVEKTYTRPEIMQGDVRVEQGAAEVVSTQIIQTQSTAQQTVGLPQINTTGQISTTGYVQQQQYVSTIPMKKKKSSSSSDGKKVSYKVQAQAQPIQMSSFHQVNYQPQAQVIQAAPQIVQQTLPPVQTIQRSYHYAQAPVQAIPQRGFQQTVYQQQPSVVAQPGVQMGNFQGVRLADSHILMK